MGSPLLQITEFLRALLHATGEGRVVVTIGPTNRMSSVKYLLLNPASQFHDIVKECRYLFYYLLSYIKLNLMAYFDLWVIFRKVLTFFIKAS